MPIGLVSAGVAAAGAIGGAVISSSASKSAAKTQAAGADAAAQVQQNALTQQQAQFDQSRADLAPYREVGTNALLALSDQLGIARPAGMESTNTGNPTFQKDPGYQFAFDEGLKAVDARFPGMSKSGAKAKALTTYGQGVADQQYGNWLSRLSGLAGTGQTATNTSTTVNANNANAIGTSANNTGNLLENAAAARASGYVGSNNAFSSGINSLATIAGRYANDNYGINPVTITPGIGGGYAGQPGLTPQWAIA